MSKNAVFPTFYVVYTSYIGHFSRTGGKIIGSYYLYFFDDD
jgi:hypothetical protein